MSRSFNRSNTLPSWEADRLNRQARKAVKQSRKATSNKRNAQDALHKVDQHDTEVQYYETC
jgi:hypothetical protein